jgi:hypothetical protein
MERRLVFELYGFEKYTRLSTVCNMIMMYPSEMGNRSYTAQPTRLDNGLTALKMQDCHGMCNLQFR